MGLGKKVALLALALAGAGLVAALALFGLQRLDVHREQQKQQAASSSAQVAQRRAERTNAVITVAPAPLPSGVPLIEREGNDAYGGPRSYVDPVALRSLLHHERYAELSRYLEQFQREFEADAKKELWPIQAATAFDSAEPELLSKLEAWAKATPDSFAPYLALGAHWSAVAGARRGAEFAAKTARADLDSMAEAAKVARRNLMQAEFKAPKLVAAIRFSIWIAILTSQRQQLDEAFARGLKACPSCFWIRSIYMNALKPRWGGSFERMQAFAKDVPLAQNPRLALLIGYVDNERAQVAREAKRLDDALAAANAACALGDHADFLQGRAYVYNAKQDPTHAEQDLDRALELAPARSDLRMERAQLYVMRQDWEHAAQSLIAVMRVDPTATNARWAAGHTARGLDAAGWAAHLRGDHAPALQLLDLALQLAPFDAEVNRHHEEAVRAGSTGTPEELAKLEAAIKTAPDDFRAHQTLDYALAKQKKYARVIEMWTEYISRHPEDGNAYLERGGAHHNTGQRELAAADLKKACELGVNQACAYLKRLPK